MKKMLIFSQAMEIGGAERALLGLLENIDTSKWSVDLFLMRHQGELMKHIPSNIKLLPEIPEYACLAVPIKDVIKKRFYKIAVDRILGKLAAAYREKQLKLAENDIPLEYSHKFTAKDMPKISDMKYDLAISFLTPHYFCINKVEAKTKIAWIHTDYSFVDVDIESQAKMWGSYDWIASISEEVTKSFLTKFPMLKNKILLLPNVMPTKYLMQLTEEFSVDREMVVDGSIKLLSIGRFCKAKNFDNVPMICRILENNGVHVKWYLIGYGGDEELIRSKIDQTEMSEKVIILGKKENPYPYIKACDIYVQPSRYEGKCVSVIEAQMLNKPVVITNYSTSKSQLEDGIDGIIVPIDNEGCANGILSLIRNRELQEQLIDNTKGKDYSNKQTIKILESIMDRVN